MGCERLRAQSGERARRSTSGETSADGRFTLLPIVCLGACDHAPAMMIDDDLHGDVDRDEVDVDRAMLARYRVDGAAADSEPSAPNGEPLDLARVRAARRLSRRRARRCATLTPAGRAGARQGVGPARPRRRRLPDRA